MKSWYHTSFKVGNNVSKAYSCEADETEIETVKESQILTGAEEISTQCEDSR